MKKFSFLLFSLFLSPFFLSPFFLNAQPFQLPDGGFETWKRETGVNGQFWEYKTNYFYTLNELYAIEIPGGAVADLTAFREERANHIHSGNYSIRLVSGEVQVGDFIFLPGMVGTISEDFVGEFLDDFDVSITRDWAYDTPHALTGWYKYEPKNGDSALIDIGLSFPDEPGSDPEEGFVAKMVIKETVSNWTHFTIPIPEQYRKQYFNRIRVLFVASAGVNFAAFDECKGQKGSTLWVDNVSLIYNLGVKQDLFSTLTTKAFPNPATDVLNIELNEHFAGKVMVYNITGSLVMEENITGTQCQLNTSALVAGNYIYKLMEGNTIFAQGKFVVQ